MSHLKTLAEEQAYEAVMAEHDLRRTIDRAAGLHNELKNAAGSWREFLEKSHAEIFDRWPDIFDAVVDARRWENPIHFNGTFAEKVARARPLPAISTVGQMERIIMRALVMLDKSPAEREALVKEAYTAEHAARKLCEAARTRKLGVDDIDTSGLVI